MAYRSLVMTALELIHRQATRRQRREKASRSPGDLNSLALARRRRDDLSYKMPRRAKKGRLEGGATNAPCGAMAASELATTATRTSARLTSRAQRATVGPARW